MAPVNDPEAIGDGDPQGRRRRRRHLHGRRAARGLRALCEGERQPEAPAPLRRRLGRRADRRLPRHREGGLRPRDDDERDLARAAGSDSPELEVLSKIGGGRFYLIEDATKLPPVFTQETILAARSAIHEIPVQGVRSAMPGAAHARASTSTKQPLLEGYVVDDAQAARERAARRAGGRPGARDVERGHRARRCLHERLQGPVGPEVARVARRREALRPARARRRAQERTTRACGSRPTRAAASSTCEPTSSATTDGRRRSAA